MTDEANVPVPPQGFGLSDLALAALDERLGGFLVDGIKTVVRGAEEDLREFGIGIARTALVAGMAQDHEMMDEIRAQIDLLMEVNRIRVTREHRALVLGYLEAGARMIFKTALAFGASWMEDHLLDAIRR